MCLKETGNEGVKRIHLASYKTTN